MRDPRKPMSEAELYKQVKELATYLGYEVWHFHDSRRQVGIDPSGAPMLVGDNDAADWPDTMLARRLDGRFMLRELKRESESPTPGQAACLDLLAYCGLNVGVWRPSDLPTTIPRELR